MTSARTIKNSKLQADIVIIGAGAAGFFAAVAAVESGIKNIALLEERRILGGNGIFPEGIFAAGSYLQKRQGIDASTDSVFKMAREFSHWKTNPRLVRALIDKSADTIL